MTELSTPKSDICPDGAAGQSHFFRRFKAQSQAERGRSILALPGLLFLTVFFVVPLIGIIVVSFGETKDFEILYNFNVKNYQKVLEPLYFDVIVRTLKIAILVATVSLLIGFPVAYYLARKVKRWRMLLLILIIAPLWTSYLVRTFAWVQILGANGLINYILNSLGIVDEPVQWLLYSEFAVIIALVHINMPFMILPLYAVLERIDVRIFEAAYDLGASPSRVIRTITIPLAMPGIIIGWLFVFIPSIGAFVTPELVGGTEGLMIGSVIAQQFGTTFQYPFGSALSVTLIILILAVTGVMMKLMSRRSA